MLSHTNFSHLSLNSFLTTFTNLVFHECHFIKLFFSYPHICLRDFVAQILFWRFYVFVITFSSKKRFLFKFPPFLYLRLQFPLGIKSLSFISTLQISFECFSFIITNPVPYKEGDSGICGSWLLLCNMQSRPQYLVEIAVKLLWGNSAHEASFCGSQLGRITQAFPGIWTLFTVGFI